MPSPLELLLCIGVSGRHLIHGSLSPLKRTTHTASQSVQPFLHSTQQCRFPLKIAPLHGGMDSSNTFFLGPIRVHNSNGILIGSAGFHSSQQSVVESVRACPSRPKLPLPWGNLNPHLTCGSLGPTDSASQTASRSVSRCTAHARQSLYFTMGPLPPKLPFPWRIPTPI